MDEKPQAARKHSFIDLIRTPKMRKQSLIVFYLWYVCSSFFLSFSTLYLKVIVIFFKRQIQKFELTFRVRGDKLSE